MQGEKIIQKPESPTGLFAEIKSHVISELKDKLSRNFTYHDVNHTLDVLNSCSVIAFNENIKDKDDLFILKVSALYHDIGYTVSYKDHEKHGMRIAKEELKDFGLANDQVDVICQMILATKVDMKPNTKLQEILCDADLDYLGREDYTTIARNLFIEMNNMGVTMDEDKWKELQLDFLQKHNYHTAYSNKVRGPGKERQILEIKRQLAAKK